MPSPKQDFRKHGWRSYVIENARYGLVNWHLLIQRALFSLVLSGLVLYAVWPWLPGMQDTVRRTVVVYGFSILGEVMNEGVFPAFEAEWQAQTGEDVEFISSFAGSGTITNQLILGVPAEVAILSLELDAWRLADNGVLPGPIWHDLPNDGVLNRTPFIILVRPGNPKGIRDFSDLTQSGVEIVHPDPLTSGGAMWGILAEYGSALRLTGDEAQAYNQLAGVWRNVVAQAASARAARTQYEGGFGDALITYEQEVIYDQMRDQLEGQIIYPESTILSEHIVVVVNKNIPPQDHRLVEAFIAFLWSETGQRIFVDYGFRSVDEALNTDNSYFGTIQDPFTIDDLGGWLQAKQDIVDAIWKDRVLLEMNR
jgi:sulfate/thiosulfate transport system substrate-binding protein